jgi:hypothetical protein
MAASRPQRTIGGGLEKDDDRPAAFCWAKKRAQDEGMARTSNVEYGCDARTSDRDGEGEGRASKDDAPYRVAAAPFSQEIE